MNAAMLARWDEVLQVVDLALEVDPTARPELLDRTCSGDAELRVEVERLLAATHCAEQFLELCQLLGDRGLRQPHAPRGLGDRPGDHHGTKHLELLQRNIQQRLLAPQDNVIRSPRNVIFSRRLSRENYWAGALDVSEDAPSTGAAGTSTI